MKSIILVLLWILSLLGMVVGIAASYSLRQFLRRIPAIEDDEHLEQFKIAVTRDMYASLFIIFVMIIAVASLVSALYQQLIAWKSVGIWLGVFGPRYAVGGAIVSATEERARSIPVTNPMLKAEYDEVVRVWRSKAVPTW